MLTFLAKIFMKLRGWRLADRIPKDIKHSVVIAAPHTSNADFWYAKSGFLISRSPVKTLMKKELFKFPMSLVLKFFGAVPVDRSKANNLTEAIVQKMKASKELHVMIPPEGTRKAAKRWKTGFYFIAKMANVPIMLGYLDYGKKEAGFGEVFYPTDDIHADFEYIKKYYANITPKHPEGYHVNLVVPENYEEREAEVAAFKAVAGTSA